MLKIVVIADSLALPRPEKLGGILHEETYPYLLELSLRNRFGSEAPMVLEKGERARTVTKVIKDWTELVTWKRPEVVIVQVGVVDCAPRVFHAWQSKIIDQLNRVPYVRIASRLLLRFANKYRRLIIKALPKKVYTPLSRFRSNVLSLVNFAARDGVRLLIFVNIVQPPSWLEDRSPGFQENVRKYNEVFDRIEEQDGVQIVDMNGLIAREGGSDKFLLDDGHHLNAEGNKLLAKELECLLSKAVQMPSEVNNQCHFVKKVGLEC